MNTQDSTIFIIRDREAGNVIDEFDSLDDAEKALSEYEFSDKKEGIFTPNFYEIVESEGEEMANKAAANARLIAAAPELLQTLEVVLTHIEQTNTDFNYSGTIIPKNDVIQYIQIAINKAKGGNK